MQELSHGIKQNIYQRKYMADKSMVYWFRRPEDNYMLILSSIKTNLIFLFSTIVTY